MVFKSKSDDAYLKRFEIKAKSNECQNQMALPKPGIEPGTFVSSF